MIIKEKNKRYLIDEKRDLIIFNSIKKLEKLKPDKEDKKIIKLLKTQLEKDWRKYIISALNKLLRKYKK